MKIVVVIPTYNEVLNIAALIDALEREIQTLDHDFQWLVVDDDSPDGTGTLVREKMAACPRLHLSTGPKRTLGHAYVRGMRHALDVLRCDAVLEMDADFSHDPHDVPRLVRRLDEGSDFVIASRYVEGGTIDRRWGSGRRLLSILGNVVARYVAGLYGVRDCTAGFRAVRATVLREMNLEPLRVRGYAFQVALLAMALSRGARVEEIPVHFVDRERGESKLGLRDVADFAVNAWWIRFQSSATFLRSCIVGASGVVVNLGIFGGLLALSFEPYLASPLAIGISIVWTYRLNHTWTFRSRRVKDRVLGRRLKFNARWLITFALSYATFALLSTTMPGVSPMIVQLLSTVPGGLSGYFLSLRWEFGDGGRRRW